MSLIGYARVSTGEQNLDLQLDELKSSGCKKVFTDTTSGAKSERPGLSEALAYLRPDDTLVVWKLDRLGRSLRDLIDKIALLKEAGIQFRSLQESIDTSTPTGKLQFHIFSALAEFERDIIRERTMAGLRAARARGRMGGRKPKMTKEKISQASKFMKNKELTVREICEMLGVSSSTLYRYIKPDGSTVFT